MDRQKNHKRQTPLLTRRQLLGLSIGTASVGITSLALWRYQAKLPPKISKPFTETPPAQSPSPNSPSPSSSPAQTSPPPPILPHENDYAEFLGTLNLRYIKPHEIISPHRRERNGVANVLPPREFWRRMVPTLQVADELRERLGVKLRYITSAYRSIEYNAQCPGASPGSYHTKNIALDLVYDCPTTVAIAEARKMRDEGLFKGGLGLYKSFIHIDTRGRNANWGSA